jgi:hypothetical protein
VLNIHKHYELKMMKDKLKIEVMIGFKVITSSIDNSASSWKYLHEKLLKNEINHYFAFIKHGTSITTYVISFQKLLS